MLARSVRVAAFAVALLLLVAPAPAYGAEAKTSSLSWLRMPGADACVATQVLARAVEERLGRTVFVSASQADVSVEGRVEKRAKGWHAVITVRDATGAVLGTRELDRADGACEAMTESLALVIAVMIDPEAATRPKPVPLPEAEPAPERPEPVASPSPPSFSPPPPGPPPTAPWRFEGHVGATVHYGLVPAVVTGATLQGILYPPGSPVGLRGYTTLFLPTAIDRDGVRASFDMLYGGGSLCPTLRRRVNLLACVGGQVGFVRPRSESPTRPVDESLLPVLDAVVELRIHVPIVGPLGVAGGVLAGLPILRPEVDYARSDGSGNDILHRAKPYVIGADLGVGLVFP